MRKCYIIGSPLKKPRSLNLWRSYFKKKNIKASMEAKEINTNQLKNFIVEIKNDKDFLASAVTMPLKNEIYKYIIPGDKVAKKTKAINFIIKKKKKIYGYNTDVTALIKLIEKKFFKNVIILGLGGVGNALFNLLKENSKIKLYAISHSKSGKKIFKNFKDINLSKINLIINCTPLGSNLKRKYLNKTRVSEKDLKKLNKDTFVFDIIYNPKLTKLLRLSKKLKLKHSNGVEMNTLQAKTALEMVYKNI